MMEDSPRDTPISTIFFGFVALKITLKNLCSFKVNSTMPSILLSIGSKIFKSIVSIGVLENAICEFSLLSLF